MDSAQKPAGQFRSIAFWISVAIFVVSLLSDIFAMSLYRERVGQPGAEGFGTWVASQIVAFLAICLGGAGVAVGWGSSRKGSDSGRPFIGWLNLVAGGIGLGFIVFAWVANG